MSSHKLNEHHILLNNLRGIHTCVVIYEEVRSAAVPTRAAIAII